jgi:primosomal protein N' (replication factor Y)
MQAELFPEQNAAPVGGTYLLVAACAPVYKAWTYHAGDEFGDHFFPGQRVAIPIGKSNQRSIGFVLRRAEADEIPKARRVKSILGILDHKPLMTRAVFDLARWMAEYYCCPPGFALAAVVPAAVKKRAGERKIRLAALPAQPGLAGRLSPKARRVIEVLAGAGKPVRVEALAKTAGCGPAVIRRLVDLKLIELRQVREWDLEKDEGGTMKEESQSRPTTATTLRPSSFTLPPSPLTLTAEQKVALDTVLSRLEPPRFSVVLLYGVTGSGKTEVYLRAIERVVAAGRQAIVLVPEIALTPQTRTRFAERFGSVAVLHSHMAETERHRQWRQIAEGRAPVVVGPRSAVFAPCPRVGLIVVDEEHEPSFKQADAHPRYHARDVAVLRASREGFPVVLGSATPSLESLHNCTTKPHFVRVDLTERIDGLPLPPVTVVDMRAEVRRRPGAGVVSGELETALRAAFAKDEQAILLLNRRGHSTYLLCPKCSHVVRCPRCDVAMVWHRTTQIAHCHYCGSAQPPPPTCPACNRAGIRGFGAGTQKLEDEIARFFPGVPAARMDSDTTAAAGSHERILKQFELGELRLLFGTQMIAKGLHFPAVTVVGVVNADTALALSDFRAGERTFQLIAQVAGRAGRSQRGGRVVVQSFEPQAVPIVRAASHDYFGFAEEELRVRKAYEYPPFARLVSFIVHDERRQKAAETADRLAAALRKIAEAGRHTVRFRGPAPAPLARLEDRFRFLLLASAGSSEPLQAMLAAARVADVLNDPAVAVDVDPMAII